MTLQHIVLFAFPHELSDADYGEMRSQVASWPSEIGGMARLRFGNDLTGDRTRGYSRLLYMEFAGADELRRYQQHPVHRAFQRWLVERSCTPLAFDYFIDDDTDLMAQNLQDVDRTAEERR
jgi:Stress responsive A/B Barrel Domain